MRSPFNDSCDIFKGPGTPTPGLFVGTFACRFILERAIVPDDPGYPSTVAYLTIEDYNPFGVWTSPFFGVDAGIGDRVFVASRPADTFVVIFTDTINWQTQDQYYRAYLAYDPLPPAGPEGGIIVNDSASRIVPQQSVMDGGVLVDDGASITPGGGLVMDGGVLVDDGASITP